MHNSCAPPAARRHPAGREMQMARSRDEIEKAVRSKKSLSFVSPDYGGVAPTLRNEKQVAVPLDFLTHLHTSSPGRIIPRE